MTYLDDRDIDEIREAAVSAELAGNRAALFAQISGKYWGTFAAGSNPVAQILIDLARLNRDPPLKDGSIPLRRWLKNAIVLSGGTEHEDVFRSKLRLLDERRVAARGAQAVTIARAIADWSDDQIDRIARHPFAAAMPRDKPIVDGPSLVDHAAKVASMQPLLAAALAQRVDADLVALAEQKGLLPAVPVAPSALQKLVRERSAFVDVRTWRMHLAEREAAVCRVELRANGMWRGMGTGFLVGPDLVMTNQHVVAPLLTAPPDADGLRFRFDFFTGVDGAVSEGVLFLPATPEWLVASSPPSAADERADGELPEPTDDELDFALIRLAKPAGDLPVGGDDPSVAGRRRGWLRVMTDAASTSLGDGAELLVLQHPDGEPLKLAFGSVTRLLARRVRYDTRTEEGSSGSPCLDAKLRLVALHHAGDPRYPGMRRGDYNQGIPIQRIAARCEEAGLTFRPWEGGTR
jgi:hypothetical protein